MQKLFSVIYAGPSQPDQRVMIDVPFNVWEEFNMRGPIPVKARINGYLFECSLVPKGKGFYAIRYTKMMQKIVKACNGDTLQILIEPVLREPTVRKEIDPASARKIDRIELVMEPVSTACGQACIAMLAGAPIEEVFQVMKTKGPTSSAMLMDAMYHYKIRHAEKFYRLSKKHLTIPETCLLNIRMPGYGHWAVYHKGIFYDPEFGMLAACHEDGRISSFLEIYI